MKSPRTLLLNTIRDLVVTWQDGLPSEGEDAPPEIPADVWERFEKAIDESEAS